MPETKTRGKGGSAQRGQPARRAADNPFDAIVRDALAKSVVTAPSDPTGGQKLPERQEGAPKRKGRGKTQYMAVFDREAQRSDDQMDDWERDTNATTDSPERFVNDDDDTPEDPDEGDEDSRGNETYDPYSDDAGDEDPGEDTVPVRAHRRRKRVEKSAVAHDRDDEDDNLSDDDAGDEDEEDDDDLDEDGEDGDEAAEDDRREASARRGRRAKQERATEDERVRKSRVRKSLGRDGAEAYDGVPVLKALTDTVFDESLETRRYIRQVVRAEIRSAVRYLATQNEQMAKSLTTGMVEAQNRAGSPVPAPGEPLRKGVVTGEDPRTTRKRFGDGEGFNLAKSLDVIDEALQKGLIELRDATILENDKHPNNLSNAAKQLLHDKGLI